MTKPVALITGTRGFVGGHLAKALRATHEIIEVNRRPPALGRDHFRWDLGDPLPAGLPDAIDLVVHTAATDGRAAADSAIACFAVNTAATAQLLAYASRAKASQFVFISTGSVYPLAGRACREVDMMAPADHYAASKAAAESLVAGYAKQFKTLCLRLFHPYGPGQALPRLVPGLVSSIRRGETVSIHGEAGLPRVNPIYIDDLITWTTRLVAKQCTGVYNIAGKQTKTIRELAEQIGSTLGRAVRYEIGPDVAGDRLGDIGKVVAETGYLPQTMLAPGIRAVIGEDGRNDNA